MPLSAEAVELLRIAVRARPTTYDELVALGDLPDAHLQVLADLARHHQSDDLGIEFVHGPMAPTDAAFRLQERRAPVASWAVMPDAQRLQAPPAEVVEPFLAMLSAQPEPDRIILGTHDGSEPELRRSLGVFEEAGADFRTHDHLPSWFVVESDDTVLLPVTWGDHWPTSVMILRHEGIAGIARHVFTSLWRAAQPVFHDDPSWRPLVRLLATGTSVDAAARTLGISARTARRRMNEAMRYHRVHTPFELGVAVGRTETW